MPGISAAGVMGFAVEAVSGTYLAPTRFAPIRGESLEWQQSTNWRRVIRQTTDPIGAVAGDGHVEGDIDMEVLDNVLPHFLRAARGTLSKSGSAPDFVYTFTANHVATPSKTLSITVVRNGVVFGYTGCVVGSMNFSVDNGMYVVTLGIVGNAEATAAAPTPAYIDDVPFGSGTYNLQIPTATQIFDADNFTFSVDDSAEPQMRLKNVLGAQFVKFGERTAQITVDRDFETRAQYDSFKNLTAESVTLRAQRSVGRYVEIIMPATVKDAYSVNLGGVGDLVRASTTYMGTHHAATGSSYQIVVGTSEDITLP